MDDVNAWKGVEALIDQIIKVVDAWLKVYYMYPMHLLLTQFSSATNTDIALGIG